jgi:hypothetical protein
MAASRRRPRRRGGSCSCRWEAAARSTRRDSLQLALNHGDGCVWGGRLHRCRPRRICLCPAEPEACSGSCLGAGHDGDESRRGHPRKQTYHSILLCSSVGSNACSAQSKKRELTTPNSSSSSREDVCKRAKSGVSDICTKQSIHLSWPAHRRASRHTVSLAVETRASLSSFCSRPAPV